MNVNLILTTGGTGFSPRDVTPEATKQVIDKEAPGMALAMIKGSLQITPMAMLSRPVCGIRKSSLIINLPGSPKGAVECLQMVAPAIKHAVDLIHGSKTADKVHKQMQVQVESAEISHHCCHRDPEAVAYRPRTSPFPMVSVDKAQRIVMEHCSLLGVEKIHYFDSVNRVLAADVFAQDPLPPFPASMKDGYAVIAADGLGRRTVIGSSTAGSFPEQVAIQHGFCARISTGAPVPSGADSVVMVEDTKLIASTEDGKEEIEIEIMAPVTVGHDIRPLGSDIKDGEKVLGGGTLLTAADIGILATIGREEVDVYALPTVAVLSTGNELVESKPQLPHGSIRDSNRPTLLTLLKQNGFLVTDAGIAADSMDTLFQHVTECLERCDVLVCSGGVSMGEKDLLRHVIAKLEAEIHFARVNMKPGKPTTFATCQFNGRTKLIFGLPGNPVSAVVTCHLYVIPACRKMAGHPNPSLTTMKAELCGSQDFNLDPRPEYHRVRLHWSKESSVPRAISTGNQVSSRLLSVVGANALAVLPGKTQGLAKLPSGTLVDVVVIDRV